MDQRVAFIADWLREEWSMTELAERYAISRKTAYKWVTRYQTDTATGLADRSRAPHAHGRRITEDVAEAIVALRRQYRRWGPKKLRVVLQRREPTRLTATITYADRDGRRYTDVIAHDLEVYRDLAEPLTADIAHRRRS